MLYWFSLITLILLLLILVFFLPVKIILEYKLEGLNDYALIKISLLGDCLKYRYRFPGKSGKKGEKKKRKEDEEVERSKLNGFMDKIKNIGEIYAIVKTFKKFLREKILLEEYRIDVDIGTGDAYYTGILYGMIWSGIGTLNALISNTFKTLKRQMRVRPDFSKEKFKAEVYCIFRIKMVHIIVVGIKFLLYYLRKKKLKAVV